MFSAWKIAILNLAKSHVHKKSAGCCTRRHLFTTVLLVILPARAVQIFFNVQFASQEQAFNNVKRKYVDLQNLHFDEVHYKALSSCNIFFWT